MHYLDSTPMASLGVVVMRHGVAEKLAIPTTNRTELLQTLERDYFLYGGAGSLSLENGLRMALSELVNLKSLQSHCRTTATRKRHVDDYRYHPYMEQTRVLLVSAAVTLIDPTDVLRLIHLLTVLHIRVDIISFTGAVHVFETCARVTGGVLSCPLSYDHLRRVMREMALVCGFPSKQRREDGRVIDSSLSHHHHALTHAKRQRIEEDHDTHSQHEQTGPSMIPIGFPLYLNRLT
uniref:General transcription factor IIH subunit 2 n=1 Tax=Lygus hesperus TaxID=30085 RepID=A0A0A9W5T0_LYGHE